MERIRLHWTPGVPEDVLGHLLAQLPPLVGRRVSLGHPFELLTAEYQMPPAQFQATALLRRLCPLRPAGELLLALTGADLSAPGYLFIFGEADPAGGGAILSLFRFGDPAGENPPRAIYLRRALTEAVHEAGHLLRLEHCPDPQCAMHFSDALADTDRKGPGICDDCRRKLH